MILDPVLLTEGFLTFSVIIIGFWLIFIVNSIYRRIYPLLNGIALNIFSLEARIAELEEYKRTIESEKRRGKP